MVTADPQLILVDEDDYLSTKWTYEEYQEELCKPIDYPDPQNKDDPRYYRKYAHNVPPPEAYFYIPPDKDAVATNDKTKSVRRVWYGWNNITDFERQGIKALKQFVESHKDYPRSKAPQLSDRDWLKWIAANQFDVAKAGERVIKHFNWKINIPRNPRLTDNALRLL